MNPRPSSPSEKGHVFSEATFRSPLDELRTIAESKAMTAQKLGEDDRVELYRRACEIACERLARFLNEEV